MSTQTIQAIRGRNSYDVAPDVFGLRIAIVNVFFIGLPQYAPWVLVDAGIGDCSAQIIRTAEARFGTGTRPQAIILTHGHFDHVGALETLAKHWDVPVYAHELELPFLTGLMKYPPADPLAGGGAMAWMGPIYPRGPIDLGDRVQPIPADGQIPGLPDWRVIHTPGHAPGHISLFRDIDRLLITGDAVITTRQESLLAVLSQRPEVRRPPAYFTPNWPAAQSSVETIAALRPELIASGHGPPMNGPLMREQLSQLAQNFSSTAIPRHGRAVAALQHSPIGTAELMPTQRWAGAQRGATAGLLATLPMTAVMLAAAKIRRHEDEPFPPREVTAVLAGRMGIWQSASPAQRNLLTLISHFGYGTLVGALSGAWATAQGKPGMGQGLAYGMLIWAASYAGWLPAARIVNPPWRESFGRTLQMVASHLIWGATLAWLLSR